MNKRVIVIGGNGALGNAFVNIFKNNPSSWKVLSLDYSKNKIADSNLVLNKDSFNKESLIGIRKEISDFSNQFDLMVNVAGGWNGVGLKDDNIFDSLDLMLKQNLFSSVLGVHLAYHFLKKDSHLVLTGAMSPYLNQGYNFMMTYQLSKNSVHHLTELINWNKEDKFKILTLLPKIIDTKSNREAMKDADFSQWSKPETIASTIKEFADNNNFPEQNFLQV